MRGVLWFFCALCTAWNMAWHAAAERFPYTASISVSEIEVRCGPSWDYYVTTVLKRGSSIEVYRQEPGGWLAIRPPADSFSWVAARHVQPTNQADVVRVSTDGVVAWVGSNTTQVSQHKWQVRLKQGELLQVLGKKPVAIGPGFAIETYYKVAPPAGEFRWIHTQYATAPRAGSHQVAQSTIQLADFQPASVQRLPRTETSPAKPAHQAGSAPAVKRPTWTSVTDSSASPPAKPPPAKPLSNTALKQQVEQLNIDLGTLVSRPMQQWKLETLRTRAQRLLSASNGTRWADQVRELARRVRDFEDLRRRYEKMLESDFSNVRDQKPGVSAAPRLLDADNAEDSSAKPRHVDPVAAYEVYQANDFDAEGWLVPVHSTKRIAPPFALLDDKGRVRCYVSPLPGLNLRRYQRKYVGLYGQRRYVKSLKAPHVTAERVVKEKHERRTD